jgi:4-hydroxybenzoate polyprenyltransferase
MNPFKGNTLALGILVVLVALLLLLHLSPWVGLVVGLVGLAILVAYYRRR